MCQSTFKKIFLESEPVPKCAEIPIIEIRLDYSILAWEFSDRKVFAENGHCWPKIIRKLVWTGPANYQTWPRRF